MGPLGDVEFIQPQACASRKEGGGWRGAVAIYYYRPRCAGARRQHLARDDGENDGEDGAAARRGRQDSSRHTEAMYVLLI